jgi:hypothetical protein
VIKRLLNATRAALVLALVGYVFFFALGFASWLFRGMEVPLTHIASLALRGAAILSAVTWLTTYFIKD